MRKGLKVLSSALLLGLSVTSVVTLSSCNNKEEQQAEIDKAREEAVLEYAKESASKSLDSYVAKTLEVLGYQKTDVSGLDAKVSDVKSQITAATTKAEVESKLNAGIASVYQLISAKVTENNTSIANQISTLTEAKNKLQSEKTALEAQVTEKDAQIATLQSEKTALEAQKAELEGNKTELEAQKATLEAQITEKNTQIATLQSEKAALEAQKTALETQIATLETQIENLSLQVKLEQGSRQYVINAIKNLSILCNSFYPNAEGTESDKAAVKQILDNSIKSVISSKNDDEIDAIVEKAKTDVYVIYDKLLDESTIEISTVEEFIEFIRGSYDETGLLQKNVKLMADIDLTGQEIACLDSNTYVYTGVFNGNGHTIKNYAIHNETAKTGFLFGGLKDAVIMNTRFDSISVTAGTIESVAVVAGLVNGNTQFKNLEFTSCSVSTNGNYAALCASRNDAKNANLSFENITVKMSCSVKGAKYGGVLLGDMVNSTTTSFKNIDMAITTSNTGGQLGGLAGRVRGGNLSFENVIMRDVNVTATSNKTGLFFDGASAANVSFKNVLLLNANLRATKQASLLDGGGSAAKTTTYENIYAVNASCVLDAGAQALPSTITQIEATSLTKEWYKYILQFDNLNWEWDVDTVKIKGTSPNHPSEGATIESISLVTSGVKSTYLLNEEFSAAGLVVKAKYSDGVEIAITSADYTVDASAVDKTQTGEYNVVVKVGDAISQSFKINYITVESIYVDETELDNILVGDETFDKSKVVVIGVLTDGSRQNVSSACTITASDPVDGVITVTVKYNDTITAQYSVTKISTALVGENPSVAVDASYAGVEGTVVENKATFKSLQNAIDYIESSGIKDTSVIVYLAAGTYNEKITIKQPNIRLVGAGQESTKISYGLAAGHKLPSLSGTWGTDGSATVTVASTATGFYAEGIMFENSFDYLHDNSVADKQALAMLCSADQAIFKNCGFFGYQDTLETKSGRQLFDSCYIAGAVDFIFGTNSTSVFKDCEIKSLCRGENQTNGGYITAAQGCNGTAGTGTVEYGFVFLNCRLTAEEGVLEGSVSLGRPWRTDAQVAYINCEMGAHISKMEYPGSAQSRWEEMNGDSPAKARFFEYGSTGAGAIAEAVTGGKFLTEEEAAKYTLANMFAAVNGAVTYDAAWDGTLQGPAIPTTTKAMYYFNGGTESIGYDQVYTLTQAYNGSEGTLGDLSLDGKAGKIEPRTANPDTQINNGAVITYTATASGTMTFTANSDYINCNVTEGENAVATWTRGDGKNRVINVEAGKTYTITFTATSYIQTLLIELDKA